MSAEHTPGISKRECASTPFLVFADPYMLSTRKEKPEERPADQSKAVLDILNAGKSRLVVVEPDLAHLGSASLRVVDALVREIDNAYHDSSATSVVRKLMSEELSCCSEDLPSECPHGDARLIKTLILNEVEAECARRGLPFVRGCDSVLIFVSSKSAQSRVSRSMQGFLERVIHADGSLHLRLASPEDLDVGGFSFARTNAGYERRISKRAEDEFKNAIRRITSRSSAQGTQSRKGDLLRACGRFGRKYSCVSDWDDVATQLNEWIRRRLCALLWKQWKRVRSKVAALKRLGVPHDAAMMIASSRRGFWAMATSDILKKWLPFSALRKMGFSFLAACASR